MIRTETHPREAFLVLLLEQVAQGLERFARRLSIFLRYLVLDRVVELLAQLTASTACRQIGQRLLRGAGVEPAIGRECRGRGGRSAPY